MSTYAFYYNINEARKISHEGIIETWELNYNQQQNNHKTEIKVLENSLIAKNDYLKFKNEQVIEYRERLGLIPASGNQYSKLNHNELKKETLDLIKNFREFYQNHNQKHNKLLFSKYDDLSSFRIKLNKQHKNLINRYNNQFKTNLILIKEEILSRLADDIKEKRKKKSVFLLYEYPINYLGMKAVADHLETLAKSL